MRDNLITVHDMSKNYINKYLPQFYKYNFIFYNFKMDGIVSFRKKVIFFSSKFTL